MKRTLKAVVKAHPQWSDLPRAGTGFCDHCREHGRDVSFGADGRQVCEGCHASAAQPHSLLTTHHSLRCGGDAEAATRLKTYVSAAADGLRRIIIAGLYIDYLISQLPHGHLRRWIETHCPDITFRTVDRWRAIAAKVLVHCDPDGERVTGIRCNPAAILDVPMELVPTEMRDVRARVDELIEGRSFRQLTFEFKQAEAGPDGELRVKRGRRKGEGGYHAKQNPSPEEVEQEGRSLAIEALFTLRTAIANVMASNYLIEMSVAEIESTQNDALRLTHHLRDVLPTVKRREALLLAKGVA